MAQNNEIQQLLLEIQKLVKILGNGRGNPPLSTPNINSGADIFSILTEGIQHLVSSTNKLSEIQHQYANEIKTQNWKDSVEGLREAIKSSSNSLSEFKNTIHKKNHRINKELDDYIEEYAKQQNRSLTLQEQINDKKKTLAVTEAKLLNDRLEIEKAELKAKQDHIQEIEKLSEETAAIAKSLAEHRQVMELLEQEGKNNNDRVEVENRETIEETTETKNQNITKQRQIEITHDSAMAQKEKHRLKGYDDKGRKKSNAEIAELKGELAAFFKENTKGRIIGEGAKIAAKTGAKGMAGIASGAMNVGSLASGASAALSKAGPYGAAAAGILEILKVCFDMFAKVDKAASDYARSVGGGHYAQVKMRKSAADLAVEMSNFGGKAYEAEEILKRMAEASEALGRNLEYLSTDDLRSLQDLKDFGISDETIAQMETFGISVHNVSKQVADLYGESGKRGLNAKATIKAFTSNLKMAQNYTFARGQKALMDMAMKSAQLKFNLRDAEQFANKVSTLEGAMNAGAQLSVLGGNFAMQGNPLAMMYNGLNDVEGLQEQMLAMTKGMARWDSKKGQLDISAFDRERLKAMSQATGIDYSDLTSQALNQARVDRVSKQIGGGVTKQQEEYIKNIASLDENGRAYVQMDGEKYTMEQLKARPDLMNRLEQESNAKDIEEGSDIGKVIANTRSIQDKLDDIIKTLKNYIVKLLMKMAGLKDHEKAAMDLGISLDDKATLNQLKRENRRINNQRIGQYAKTGAVVGGVTTGGAGAAAGAAIGALGAVTANGFIDDTEALKEYAKANKLGMYAEQKANGGYISGPGGPKDDAIPAKLSNGEFVMNATATQQFRPLLEDMNEGKIGRYNRGGEVIKNGLNLMKHMPITGRVLRLSEDMKTMLSGNNSNHSVKIEFGTLTLKLGDLTKVLDSNEVASKLLNNSTFVDNIVKEIGIRTNFGYRKDDSNNKFLDSPFIRNF